MTLSIVQSWFQNNGHAQLNETKCQFLVIESSRSKRAESASLKVLSETSHVKNHGQILGITIDHNINMKKHIKNICQSAGNQLNAQSRIAKCIVLSQRQSVMKSFVSIPV